MQVAGEMTGVVYNDSPGIVSEKVKKNKECPEYGTAEGDLNTTEEEKSFRVPMEDLASIF